MRCVDYFKNLDNSKKPAILFSSMKPAALQILNVSKTFSAPSDTWWKPPKITGKKVALDDVTLMIPKGEIVGFLGPNGAGKTTLIKIIVGLITPDRGTCEVIDPKGVAIASTERSAKLKLGYLPERPYYHEYLSAEEFLIFHGNLLGLSTEEVKDKTEATLKRVGLKISREQKLKTFSKGMLQRIGFAQALLHDPEILVLDEPMSGLDPLGRREVRDLILDVASTGKTIFFSTHIINDVEIICNNVAFIQLGKLKGYGSIESLLGKTTRSVEIRYALESNKNLFQAARKTMDGWVLTLDMDENLLEQEISKSLKAILDEKGLVKSVVPRRNSLEDLFFADSK